MTLPVALQIYSIREDAEEDFAKAMKTVKKMGYDGVELAGLYGHTPEEIRDCLGDINLIPISAHIPYAEFEQDLKGTVNAYKTIGCKYLVVPYLVEEERYGTDRFWQIMSFIPQIADECLKEGMTLLYHNHDFEFEKTADGTYVLDYIYQQIPADQLQVELDTCWVKVAGVDPVEYLKQYEGRCPVVHLKDYTGTLPVEFAAVGYGVQNIPSILEESLKAETKWVVVEQDSHTTNTALEDARLSREYLRSLGW